MPIIRMSAVEQFGVPFDNHSPEALGALGVVKLLGQYGVRGVIIEYFGGLPLDITPPYFEGGYKYSLTLDNPDSGRVDFIPNMTDPIAIKEGPEGMALIDDTSIAVGRGESTFILQGPSPRYPGACIHELIAYMPPDIR